MCIFNSQYECINFEHLRLYLFLWVFFVSFDKGLHGFVGADGIGMRYARYLCAANLLTTYKEALACFGDTSFPAPL